VPVAPKAPPATRARQTPPDSPTVIERDVIEAIKAAYQVGWEDGREVSHHIATPARPDRKPSFGFGIVVGVYFVIVLLLLLPAILPNGVDERPRRG
jgi:hypothetical protein